MSFYVNPALEATPTTARRRRSDPIARKNGLPEEKRFLQKIEDSKSFASSTIKETIDVHVNATEVNRETDSQATPETRAKLSLQDFFTQPRLPEKPLESSCPGSYVDKTCFAARFGGFITPSCAPSPKLLCQQPTSVVIQPNSKSFTLPRNWISSEYILVQKESLKDEDLVWL